MAGDPPPVVTVTTTEDDFFSLARSAGHSLKKKLCNANLTGKDSDLAWSEISEHRVTLDAVMEQFEKYVGVHKRLFNERRCSLCLWPAIQKTTPASFPENYWGKRSEDAWLLTLFAHDPSKIGKSFSMHSGFSVNEGDIHLGYVIKSTQ
jgi:hypothetical protein